MRAALPLLLLLALPAEAAERVAVRVGDHPGHGRIVFDWPAPPPYSIAQEGALVRLRFQAPGEPAAENLRRLPRNVLGLQPAEGGVDIRISEGARLRHFRLGNRVVVDILDPAPGEAAPAPARPAASSPARPASSDALRPVAPAATSGRASAAESPSTPAAPAAREAAPPPPPPAAPAPAEPPAAAPAREIALDLPADVGAALLQRGGRWLLLFDAPPPLSVEPLLAQGWQLETVAGGSLLIGTDPGPWALRRSGQRWVLLREAPGPGSEIAPQPQAAGPAGLLLPAPGARRVLILQDPETRMPLLVGTVGGGDARVGRMRRMVDAVLVETALGLAVLARSDSLSLRAGQDGFALMPEAGARLALGSPPVPPPRAAASRSFDFPAGSPAELSARLRAQQAGIAAAPPLTRGPLRLAAAETLLALGQPQEAQAMVELALREDPATAAQPRARWLLLAAALAAGRPEDVPAQPLPPLSEETALWQGLLHLARGEVAAAAPLLTAQAGLLSSYPEALRVRLLPRAAEALAAAGEVEAAAALVSAAPDTPGLELARALLAEARGEVQAALAAYDALAAGRDRRMRAEALRRGTELRLARGEITAGEAALRLERALYAWREEAQELAQRRRIAALRLAAGDPRGAFEMLQEAITLHPEQAEQLRGDLRTAFSAAIEAGPPLAAAMLHDAQPDLLPEGPEGDAARLKLVEHLLALELPGRAQALLRDALRTAREPARRAMLGARLAALQLAERDAAAALDSLRQSEAPELPESLLRERALLAARAEAQSGGRPAEALAALGAAGEEALAEHLAAQRDFAGAAAALGRHLARSLAGAQPPLPPALARAIVRHAALLALAGDAAGLAQARRAYLPLLAGSPAEAPFRLLTTDPLRGLADLPRIQEELELFRTMPARLEGLRTAALQAR
ncbi:MAG: hypothetical protein N2588_10950 [Rhodovarius sp.]|nr:hypothetical protein [Rhodovarius sp.]